MSENIYNAYTFKLARKQLNVPNLLKTGALRITYAGDGKGGYVRSPAPESFSVVTHLNDKAKNSPTPQWPNKPASYLLAERKINEPLRHEHLLYDGKYRQILKSAELLGMTAEQVFRKS